jgi:tetratricopeptide (TPR) repeat protein
MDPHSRIAPIDLAWQHHSAGRLEQAEAIYRQILAREPRHADALHLLGLVAYQRGQLDQAIQLLRQAIDANPSVAAYFSNYGQFLLARGRREEAVAALQQAVRLDPNHTPAYLGLGNALQAMDQYEPSAAAYREALRIDPNIAEAWSNLGSCLCAAGKHPEAVDALEKATGLRPDFAQAWINLATALRLAGKPERAVDAGRKAVALQPAHPAALLALGSALQAAGQIDEAALLFGKAVALQPGLSTARVNLGSALWKQGHSQQAMESLNRAIQLNPSDASAHYHRALALLSLGQYDQGWAEYEWRFRDPELIAAQPQLAGPRWTGEDISGKTILIYCEQGLGDAIQFVRFLPLVALRSAKIILQCSPLLVRLFRSLPGIAQVISRDEPPPPYDLQAPLMSLPFILRIGGSIPNKVPYLHAEAPHVRQWAQRLAASGTKVKIGVAWAGNPNHVDDRNRSIPFASFAKLFDIDATWVSLQKGAMAKDAAGHPRLLDWTEELSDFEDTAALIENLDLVISVDTAVVHVAAALGKPTWVLLPYVAHWGWLRETENSPWYPTIRLFRQRAPREWSHVLSCVREALSRNRSA